ncbi:MAG: hypothetical protein U9N55_09990 [candidate division Zixibacteria bacterium]|nr:hypothetical protein [candidate division Zixibacteria bacterium]
MFTICLKRRFIILKNETLKLEIVFFTLVAMLNLVVGCNSDSVLKSDSSTNTLSQSEDKILTSNNNEEIVVNDATIINSSIQTDVSEINERLEEVKSSAPIQSTMSKFDNNYSYAEEYSYIVNGTAISNDSTDTVDVEIVTLAMTYDADIQERVVYVSYIVVPDKGWIVQSSIVSFVEESADDGYEFILQTEEVQVWIKDFPSLYLKHINPMAQWDWNSWLKCTGKGTAAGCTGSAVGCALFAPAWGPCTAAGCAGSAAGSAVGCAIDQIW